MRLEQTIFKFSNVKKLKKESFRTRKRLMGQDEGETAYLHFFPISLKRLSFHSERLQR